MQRNPLSYTHMQTHQRRCVPAVQIRKALGLHTDS